MSQSFKMDEVRDDTYIERSGSGVVPAVIALAVVLLVCGASFILAQQFLGVPSEEANAEHAHGGALGESAIVAVTEENFVETVGTGAVVVDFWIYNCPPCEMMAPSLERLAEERKGEIVVAKINCSEHPAFARAFGINAFPTVFFFRDGKPVLAVEGLMSRTELDEFVTKGLTREPKIDKTEDDRRGLPRVAEGIGSESDRPDHGASGSGR